MSGEFVLFVILISPYLLEVTKSFLGTLVKLIKDDFNPSP